MHYGYVILIVLVLVYLCLCTNTNNKLRHMTNEYNFAHFSNITNYNYYQYPALLLTSPIKLVLHAGEYLWIPKKWWHWVYSTKSVAINFWSTSIFDATKPFTGKNTIDNSQFLKQLELYTGNIDVWDSIQDITYKTHISNIQNQNNKYIISAYGQYDVTKPNTQLYNFLQKFIVIPSLFNNKDVESNIWISPGKQDTGLHYDDNHGLLCVLQGTKTITLYPPTDTMYLDAICVLPLWAKNKPIYFEYNLYNKIRDLDDTNLPSARLLYESVMVYDNKEILKYISNTNTAENTLVWGCKLHNNIMRWEFYAYHYNHTDTKLFEFSNNAQQLLTIKNYKHLTNNIAVHSFDLFNTNIPLQPDIHFYHTISKITDLPFFGYGTMNKKNEIIRESDFVIDTQDNFMQNYTLYLSEINLSADTCKNLITTYKCHYVSVHKKNTTDIFIQYFGISIVDFILFLITFKYPQQLIIHVQENKSKYENICHEITIVYDIITQVPIRSAFYGVV